MATVKILKHGDLEKNIILDDAPINQNIAKNELLLEVLLFPINPADLLLIEGKYGIKPNLPCLIGAECVAVVNKVGKEVRSFKEGDIVMPLSRNNWASKKKVKENELIKLKFDTNLEQISMLKINPATAYLMLNNYIKIKNNDFILQNAANSAVGNHIIQLCNSYGIKNINLVRRNDVFQELYDLGAYKVLNYNNIDQVIDYISNLNIKVFIDAVAGKQVYRIASCLRNTTIINYGLLSGKKIELEPHNIIFREIQLKGFWLSVWLEKMSSIDKLNLYNHLEELIINKIIKSRIDKIYELKNIKEAICHASRDRKNGKVLVTPNKKLLDKIRSLQKSN